MASEIKCSVKRNVETLMPHFLYTHTYTLSLPFFRFSHHRGRDESSPAASRTGGVSRSCGQEFAFCTFVVSKQWRRFVTQIFRRAEEGAPTAKFSGLRFQGFVSETLRAFCLGMLSQSRDSLIEKVCFLRYNRRFRQLSWLRFFS